MMQSQIVHSFTGRIYAPILAFYCTSEIVSESGAEYVVMLVTGGRDRKWLIL